MAMPPEVKTAIQALVKSGGESVPFADEIYTFRDPCSREKGGQDAGPRGALRGTASGNAGVLPNEPAAPLVPLLGDADPLVAHTARQAVVRLRAVDPGLTIIDDPAAPPARLARAVEEIERIDEKTASDAMIARLWKASDAARRRPLLAAREPTDAHGQGP